MNLEEIRSLRKQVMRTIRSNINASTAALPPFERGVIQGQLAEKLRMIADELEQERGNAPKEMY